MQVIEYEGQRIELDDEGYLINLDAWNEAVAFAIAEREGIDRLTSDQMEILRFIRYYYRKFHFFPILNAVCKNVHQKRDCVKEGFISPIKAWKVAGLPMPDEVMINLLEFEQTPG